MRLKKLGAAFFFVALLGAVLASGALAAAITQDARWYIGEPFNELTGAETVTTEQVGEATFKTELSGGTEVVLHSTNIECVECKIENSGGSAVGSGKLKFTGVTVEKPAKCTTAATITTKALTMQADWMKGESEEPNYWKFVPTGGGETGVFVVELTGAECASVTTIIPKGSLFFQTANATEVLAVAQKANSSATINTAAGGTLHAGEKAASLTGEINFKLGSGKPFATRTAVTKDRKWYTGEPGTELTGSETVISEQVVAATFTTETSTGTKVELGMTGTECIECKIENSGGSAVGSGKLKFTGITVLKPEKCTTAATITTKPLSMQADWMKGESEEPNYWKFVVTAGAEVGFFSFELLGMECASKTTVTPKGSIFFQTVNATNKQAPEQGVQSSATINTAAGGTLHAGEKAASLTSEVKFKLTSGKAFGTH